MTTVAFVLLSVVATVLWLGTVANAITIRSSDAAGNALSHAFGVLITLGLWVLLAVLVVIAGVRAATPARVWLAAVVLVPASGAATVAAIELLSQRRELPLRWPVIIPAVAPGLLLAYAMWAYSPALRSAVPAPTVNAVVWGALVLLSIAPWPLLV